MKQIKAYHVFTQYKPITFLGVNLLVQLASALHWKKLYGSIGLICNEPFYRLLEQYPGFLEVYDTIDYTSLNVENQTVWWAAPKILCNEIIHESEYVVLDTDMIVLDYFKPVHETFSWCGFHREVFNDTSYRHLSELTDEQALIEGESNPINTALLYVKDKDIITEWVNKAKVIMSTIVPEEITKAYMITLEQLLLPTLTEVQGKTYSYVIKNIADTSKKYKNQEPLWTPNAYDREEFNKGNVINVLKYMKHVWGAKDPYLDETISYLIYNIMNDITNIFPEYKELAFKLQECIYEEGCPLKPEGSEV